ncbi:MAG TPA: homoserine kinase [Acidimicrobiales bacterium]|nr:homoserine kinase [Acidimicrobiales bacterium]
MRARAPGSSANLGPGFDTLALALDLHVEVELEPAAALEVHAEGEGAELPTDRSHLAVRVAAEVLGHERFRLRVRSAIPVGRGLGSSAAVAAAAAGAAGAGPEDALAIAARLDGHAENAAASVFGGLVAATVLDTGTVCSPFPLDPALALVLLVPDRRLATEEARAALPAHVDHGDAAFNLGRMALLLAGLADAGRLRPEATADRLHQNQRGRLFPEAHALLDGLVAAGARAACWSGAGPSLLAFCTEFDADRISAAGALLLAEHGVPGRALRLGVDPAGLVVEG